MEYCDAITILRNFVFVIKKNLTFRAQKLSSKAKFMGFCVIVRH